MISLKLILIKHSLPKIDPCVPANEWTLSSEGRRLCGGLAKQLSSHAVDSVVSSTEPKASETGSLLAHGLGTPFQYAEGLHEHDRSDVGYFRDTEDFDRAVRSLFEKPNDRVFGRETADQAHRRFADALDGALGNFEAESLAVVAHGTVISLYVARRTNTDPYALWKRLKLPSYVVLALPEYQLVEVVESMA